MASCRRVRKEEKVIYVSKYMEKSIVEPSLESLGAFDLQELFEREKIFGIS